MGAGQADGIGMPVQLNQQDALSLQTVAEYRILSVAKLATLLGRNARALRRRMRQLEECGVVRPFSIASGGRRGRPETLFALTEAGMELLKKRGILPGDSLPENVLADSIRCLDHTLLLNEFWSRLVQLTRERPPLSLRFLSSMSPLTPRYADGRPFIHEHLPVAAGIDTVVHFIPDGAFSLTRKGEAKTLLFFLEVDMGTEPLTSRRAETSDIRTKILTYQAYFAEKRYKRYEQLWKCRLQGFRLLFLTSSGARLTALSRLVRETPPSDFIWLTDETSVHDAGVGGTIWVRGGRMDRPRESILGSAATPTHDA